MSLEISKHQTSVGHLFSHTMLTSHQTALKNDCPLTRLLTEVKNIPSDEDRSTNFVTCGTEYQCADYQLAQIARDVYSVNSRLPKESKGGFQRLTQEDLQSAGLEDVILRDKYSGFQANLYSNGHQVVLAFAGTNDIHDWVTNIHESLGFKDAQYQEAIALAKRAHEVFGDRLVVTGHSLGGSLATVAALVTDSFAVIFNSAGVSKKTLSRIGIQPDRAKFREENGSIRSYSERYDPLHSLQVFLPSLPKVLGHRIALNQSNDGCRKSFLPKMVIRIIKAHKISSVIESMKFTSSFNKQGIKT